MAFTARLEDSLQTQAQEFALKLGISLNALVAVSLADYMAGFRPASPVSAKRSVLPVAPVPLRASPKALSAPPDGTRYARPKSVSDPCPCGAFDAKGHKLKFKHCHGRLALLKLGTGA